MSLSCSQNKALNLLKVWFEASNQPFFVLKGAAGTGKTFVVKHLIDVIKTSKPGVRVLLATPTYESLNNISEDIPNVPAQVIHSTLGFRPKETETERQFLSKAGDVNNHKKLSYDLVIFDEAYYCPSIIMEYIFSRHNKIKWLFLGDPNQLPPIEEKESRLISLEQQIHFTFTLKENMRAKCQEQEKLMEEVRWSGWDSNLSKLKSSKGKILRDITGRIENNQLDFIFLAYHHKVVDKMAATITDLIYGRDQSQPPKPGELIRVTGTIDTSDELLVRNNERVTVEEWRSDTIIVKRSSGEYVYLPLDDDNTVDKLKSIAVNSCNPKDWAKYHKAKRSFVEISSPWAITVHSSQGRTVDQGYIDLDNLRLCPTKEMLYVAISRSRHLPMLY